VIWGLVGPSEMRILKTTIPVAVVALMVSAFAMAQGLPRYALKPGMTLRKTLSNFQRETNRVAGLSGVTCWMYDGNAKVGWRHAACVGNYSYAGTTYRFKFTTTPLSCSQEKLTFVVPGVQRNTSTRAWKHRYFDCKH
jgi:hypothetical protein